MFICPTKLTTVKFFLHQNSDKSISTFFLRMHFQVLALIASEAEVAVVVIVVAIVDVVVAVAARSHFGLK